MTDNTTVPQTLPLLLKSLRLSHMKQQWQSLEAEAQQQGWSYGQFLQALCEQELQCRYTRRVERYLKESSLPLTKSLANFDFTYCSSINKAQIKCLATDADWLTRGENLLLFGPSGVGKTHLAAAIGRSLIERGIRVKFTGATILVQQLQQAKTELSLPSLLAKLDKYELLILDDIRHSVKIVDI